MKLFPQIPSDLKSLSDDDLTAALEAHLDIARKIRAKDADLLASIEGDDPVAQAEALVAALEAGVADIEKMKAVIAERAAGAEAFDNRIAELTAGIEDEAPAAAAAEPEATEAVAAEPEAAAEPAAEAPAAEAAAESAVEAAAEAEPVLAAARLVLPRPPQSHTPLPAEAERKQFALVASGGLASVSEGTEFDRLSLAEAMIDKRRRVTSMQAGVEERIVVASAHWEYPDDRILDPRDKVEVTQAKINAVTGEEAILASGGLCAPVTPYYDLANVSVPTRPVRDSLAAFQAVRGGLNFAAPPVLGDVTSAISYITEAEDAQGGTFATKSCQVVDCPDFSEVDVAIIAHCVQFGNLGARAFPEQVAQFNDLVMAAHSRVAETALLDNISAASTQVTATDTGFGYMGISGLLGQIVAAGAGMRSRNRMADGVRLRAIFPAWIKPWLVADLVNSQFDRFSHDDAGVVDLLRRLGNIEPTFTLDGETGTSQVFGAQSAGALLTFPSTIRWYLFPEGSWLFLDGGDLELGIVRDSVLNATNDFQIFGETFENVAFIGVESLAVTSTLCPAGATGGPDTLLC